MKLFQQLLIAPAALGLIAPVAATANELNINEGKTSDVVAEDLYAGQFDDFETTTKLSGKVVFNVGAMSLDDDVAGADMGQKLTSGYVVQYNINTSFTGEDKLYTRLKAGDMANTPWENTAYNTHLKDAHNSTNAIQVDKIWYEFPVGQFKVWAGPRIENSSMVASKPSIYKPLLKSFDLGGNGPVYGSSTSPGFGVAWVQPTESKSDFRWEVATNYAASGGDNSTRGILTDESQGKWLSKVGYGSPRMQVSLAYAQNICRSDTTCRDWAANSSSTQGGTTTGDSQGFGLRGYWKPEETGIVPSIQVGLDQMDVDNTTTGTETEKQSMWMAGLTWKDAFQDGNKLAAAVMSPTIASSIRGGADDGAKSGLQWEVYYDVSINDGMTVTPAIFGAQDISDGAATGHDDYLGAIVKTTFKF